MEQYQIAVGVPGWMPRPRQSFPERVPHRSIKLVARKIARGEKRKRAVSGTTSDSVRLAGSPGSSRQAAARTASTALNGAQTSCPAAGKISRKLGIAYRLHYEPMKPAVMEMCREKVFGKVKTFSNCHDVKAPNIRLSGSLGGGPVGDVGVYCINASLYNRRGGNEATVVQTRPQDDPRFERARDGEFSPAPRIGGHR